MKKQGVFFVLFVCLLALGLVFMGCDNDGDKGPGPGPGPGPGSAVFDIGIERSEQRSPDSFEFYFRPIAGAASYQVYSGNTRLNANVRENAPFIDIGVSGGAINDRTFTTISVRALNSSGVLIGSAELPAMLRYNEDSVANPRSAMMLADWLEFLDKGLTGLQRTDAAAYGSHSSVHTAVKEHLSNKSSWQSDAMAANIIISNNMTIFGAATGAILDRYTGVVGAVGGDRQAMEEAGIRLWFNFGATMANNTQMTGIYGEGFKRDFAALNTFI